MRCRVYIAAKQWGAAAEIARGLTHTATYWFDGWWMLSFASHEVKRTHEAWENLAGVIRRFGREWVAHYDIARYLT